MKSSVNGQIILAALLWSVTSARPADPATNTFADWTVFIANDTCPDYTWGNSEAQTRKNFAELVRSHLDEMNRTDGQPPENRDCYNLAVTQEALCFLEHYPARQSELIRRIKEGRVLVSPFLDNTLWGFQSVEGFLRSLYPARRLEREWGIPMDIAHHIEHPALPWGVPTLLAGCGVRWVNVPFLDYDCTFGQLKVPPLFLHEGPDGSQVRVILDTFASRNANYAQGAHLLGHPAAIAHEWLSHYDMLGAAYPVHVVLASGTHSDTHASSAGQTHGFAEKIIAWNAGPPPRPKLVNATLAQFCKAVDAAQNQSPFMPTVRGCFGHSWDLWPVSLARIAAEARENERRYLAAETLLALAAVRQPELRERSRADRERAEWCWAMLSDHAWNGTDDANRKENARLRRAWNDELNHAAQRVVVQSWLALGLAPDGNELTVFNSLSVPRAGLVRHPHSSEVGGLSEGRKQIPLQIVAEDGVPTLCFVTPPVDGFGFKRFQLKGGTRRSEKTEPLRATATELESPFYRLVVELKTGGIGSLIHKATGAEVVVSKNNHALCQTIFFDGQEHTMADAQSEVVAVGPVLARLRVTGRLAGMSVTNFITVYAALDRVDFEVRLSKPISTKEQRLCHLFPVLRQGAALRLETPAAVIRPEPQPQGDLLPGADARRFAVQGFVDVAAPDGLGVTIAPLDAFALRRDLGDVTFEALGNDQNYKEVSKDQGGVTEFRFRYSLRAHRGGWSNADAVSWSRDVAFPLVVGAGDLPARPKISVTVDPTRAVATCFKPADAGPPGSVILRLWETAEQRGPLRVGVQGFRRVMRTDLLERDQAELPLQNGAVEMEMRARGLGTLRLVP